MSEQTANNLITAFFRALCLIDLVLILKGWHDPKPWAAPVLMVVMVYCSVLGWWQFKEKND